MKEEETAPLKFNPTLKLVDPDPMKKGGKCGTKKKLDLIDMVQEPMDYLTCLLDEIHNLKYRFDQNEKFLYFELGQMYAKGNNYKLMYAMKQDRKKRNE